MELHPIITSTQTLGSVTAEEVATALQLSGVTPETSFDRIVDLLHEARPEWRAMIATDEGRDCLRVCGPDAWSNLDPLESTGGILGPDGNYWMPHDPVDSRWQALRGHELKLRVSVKCIQGSTQDENGRAWMQALDELWDQGSTARDCLVSLGNDFEGFDNLDALAALEALLQSIGTRSEVDPGEGLPRLDKLQPYLDALREAIAQGEGGGK